MSGGAVGLVFVSHSALIAEGLIALARQMAPDAALAAAGGTDEGGIGTSFELVSAGIASVDSGAGVVVLCDLGSAILTAETALDFLDDDVRGRVRIVDAPLVEGGVAAAVAAQTGASLDEVVAAARSAAGGGPAQHGADEAIQAGGSDDPTASHAAASVTLRNKDGLHARPAAEFVKLASTFAAKVVVNGKDAKSLLGIMSLGLVKGAVVELQADGPDAKDAIGALASLIESGFGEV
ncbi:HPr family phosphocarrier protein [Plantibacter sp. PA-3-X8]|uniref:dihydroxyacetone kinase phosphoryl donor subunit DhaM n=1 Tax=Plantibacter sp. PA-3-X8 TaxID=2480625 RepID=UPI000F5EF669|nr:dihydroxyacetone kinase phosphoryl donor subunit DhaM [Plantibacter sp. PA-3-X8]AZH83950.1 HPr family phosphocarrier protein [Plantibacter sp. PA-3-X8]